MKEIKVGETWNGSSHADMINKVLGKNYRAYMKSTVSLLDYGINGIAWFVFMDGTINGHKKEWLWRNTLSINSKKIFHYRTTKT